MVRAWWRRSRIWIAAGIVLVAGGAVLATTGGSPGRPLDPASAADSGSRALARVLAGYGTQLRPESSVRGAVDTASDVLAVLDPDAYSDQQLRQLVGSARQVVLIRPGTRALHAVSSSLEPAAEATPRTRPGCDLPAAAAAGRVNLPGDALAYVGGTRCYGGLVVTSGHLVVLGSVQALHNDHLADAGIAALDVNLLSDARSAQTLTWLRPGPDAAGSGAASIWDLFPDSVYRGFAWLVLVTLLVVVWRARRLGPAVPESLPVLVRSAELVEGHGRLYRRAGARDRATMILRSAAAQRLCSRLGLPRGSSPVQISAAAASWSGRPAAEIHQLLAGPVPSDDAGLVALARDLDGIESTTTSADSTTSAERTTHR